LVSPEQESPGEAGGSAAASGPAPDLNQPAAACQTVTAKFTEAPHLPKLTLVNAAATWERAGGRPLPVALDGSKSPSPACFVNGGWTYWKTHHPERGQIIDWAKEHDGIGLLFGSPSGNLEFFELEAAAVADGLHLQLRDLFHAAGFPQLWNKLQTYVERSPKGGLHWIYRVEGAPVKGNTKLAKRPRTPTADDPSKVQTLIETRGEGGFGIVAPSGGRTHPTGRAWKLLPGSAPGVVPTLTADEVETLHRLACTFDEMPEPVSAPTPRQPVERQPGELSPGDDYNDKTDWADILVSAGWVEVKLPGAHGQRRMWRRPGKKVGISATTGYGDQGHDLLYVFTTSTEFEDRRSYSKFAAHALLHHNGDYAAAAGELRRQGYGSERPKPERPNPLSLIYGEGTSSTPTSTATSAGDRADSKGGQAGDQAGKPARATEPELEVVMASDVIERRVVYLWDGRIPIGATSLMPGEEGIGKTLLGIRLMADLTRGMLPGEFHGTPRNVVVMAPEDGIEDVFRPRLREAGADLTRVAFVKSRKIGEDRDSVIVPRDLPLLARVMRKLDAPLLWIDSLVTSLPAELKSISYKDVATVLTQIGTWAAEARVAVAAPWHLNKNSSGDPAMRMMDSRGFRTAVRSLLMVVADPDAPEGVAQGVVVLDKANAGTLAVPALRYRIRSAQYAVQEPDELTGELVERPASCGVADWIGQLDGDGRAFIRDALAPKIEKAGSAREWLREFLRENGQTPRTEVIAAGMANGFSEDAIKRAAKGLVHSEELTGSRMVDGRQAPFRHALWSLAAQSGHQSAQSALTPPTAPTAPTGEASTDPSASIYAGQHQSVQSVQSGQVEQTALTGAPTERVGGTTGASRLQGMTREEITTHGRQLFLQALGSDGSEE
jgi:AAA domain/Bifunctional DNA primase/polymerase, N-terminal